MRTLSSLERPRTGSRQAKVLKVRVEVIENPILRPQLLWELLPPPMSQAEAQYDLSFKY